MYDGVIIFHFIKIDLRLYFFYEGTLDYFQMKHLGGWVELKWYAVYK